MKKPDPRAPFIPRGFVERDMGHVLPYRYAKKREDELERQLEARQALWRRALEAAGRKKQEWSPRMYRGEGIDLDQWPELAPLTPWERTAVQIEVYRQWGIRYPMACDCPSARQGEHYNECSPHEPFKRGGRA